MIGVSCLRRYIVSLIAKNRETILPLVFGAMQVQPLLHWDRDPAHPCHFCTEWARPFHICTDWARPFRICTGTGARRTPATQAPGCGSPRVESLGHVATHPSAISRLVCAVAAQLEQALE